MWYEKNLWFCNVLDCGWYGDHAVFRGYVDCHYDHICAVDLRIQPVLRIGTAAAAIAGHVRNNKNCKNGLTVVFTVFISCLTLTKYSVFPKRRPADFPALAPLFPVPADRCLYFYS